MLLPIILAMIVAQCPTPPEYPLCPAAEAVSAQDLIHWHGDWSCDGSVWWRTCVRAICKGTECVQDDCVDTFCHSSLDPLTGEEVISCPLGFAPAKYWNGDANQLVTIDVHACSAGGCSEPCTVDLTWPSVCAGDTREDFERCCRDIGGCEGGCLRSGTCS